MGRVEGKVAFITGAARGQGRSHAVRLAEEGADIIAIDICDKVPGVDYPAATPDDLAETVAQVEALDRRIIAERADVRDLAHLEAVVDRGVQELGRLDIVIANAGISIAAAWDEYSDQDVRNTIDINLLGVWNTVRAAAHHVIEGGNGGSIILISSVNGLKAGPFNAPYNAAKFGVTGLGRSFAIEMAKDRVRVNTIHPGPIDSEMGRGIGDKVMRLNEQNPGLLAMYSTLLPGEFWQPREISNAVVYLASDESAMVTGLAMAVDAGISMY